MAALVSLFVHLDWARFELWVAALALGGLAFGALGVAIGAAAREVSAASLLAFLVSLPIAFVALVPANAVSGTLKTVLDAIAFVFPFKAALEAVSQRLHRRLAGDRAAARAPGGAGGRLRRRSPGWPCAASPPADDAQRGCRAIGARWRGRAGADPAAAGAAGP